MNSNSRRNQSRPRVPPGKVGNVHYNPYSGHKPSGTARQQSLNKFKGVTQFTVAVIVAAIPISFYLVQPSDIQNAFASNEKDSDIKQIMSTLGGSIKDKASSVFSGDKSMKVKVAPSSNSQPGETGSSQSLQSQVPPMNVARSISVPCIPM